MNEFIAIKRTNQNQKYLQRLASITRAPAHPPAHSFPIMGCGRGRYFLRKYCMPPLRMSHLLLVVNNMGCSRGMGKVFLVWDVCVCETRGGPWWKVYLPTCKQER